MQLTHTTVLSIESTSDPPKSILSTRSGWGPQSLTGEDLIHIIFHYIILFHCRLCRLILGPSACHPSVLKHWGIHLSTHPYTYTFTYVCIYLYLSYIEPGLWSVLARVVKQGLWLSAFTLTTPWEKWGRQGLKLGPTGCQSGALSSDCHLSPAAHRQLDLND